MVDGGGLENRCTRKGTGGSNPSPSANLAKRSWAERAVLRHAATHLRLVASGHESPNPSASGAQNLAGP